MDYYKTLLVKFTFTVITLVVMIVSFNFMVDSYHIFRENPKDSIVYDLKNGNYVSSKTITSNRIDNIYDKLLFLYKNVKIDLLAIGSSRTLPLHKELIISDQNIQYLNFTTGTARLSQLAEMVGLFKKHSIKLPKNIIIGLDPWIFDEKIPLSKVKSLLNLRATQITKNYNQLFNYEYTKINFESMFADNSYIKSKNISDIRKKSKNNMIMSPFGDLYYPESQENVDLKIIQKRILDHINRCKANNFNTRCVDYATLNNIKEFVFFINYLKSNGSNVIIFLAPISPTFYAHILNNNNFKDHYKNILNTLKDLKVTVIGDYNPATFNLNDEDFMDSFHPKTKVIKQIFKTKKLISH